jgi:hypothetical protein
MDASRGTNRFGGNRMTLDPKETNEDSTEHLLEMQAREEKIRIRAYEIYLERGSHDGLDVEDWLQAEIECLGS